MPTLEQQSTELAARIVHLFDRREILKGGGSQGDVNGVNAELRAIAMKKELGFLASHYLGLTRAHLAPARAVPDWLPDVSRLVFNALEITRTYNALNSTESNKKDFALAEQELAEALELLKAPPSLPTSDPLREAALRRIQTYQAKLATENPSKETAACLRFAIEALDGALFDSAHPIPQAAPTAKIDKQGMKALSRLFQCCDSAEGLELLGKVQNYISALEQSAHLAAAPGVGPKPNEYGLLPCPKCKSDNVHHGDVMEDEPHRTYWQARCEECGHEGSEFPFDVEADEEFQAERDAKAEWNALLRPLTAPAQPDTLIREEELLSMLEKIVDRYEWACFADLGVEGFRKGLEVDDLEECEVWENMGEEPDADAIDEARALIRARKSLAAAPGKREGV